MATITMNQAQSTVSGNPLSPEELRKMNAYWRAANYLSVGQIYLMQNPLLREPLQLEHVKPRLLGHWGTTPGLNFVYVHFNRLIKRDDLNVIYIIGPGHGGPGIVANTYLEGTYSEIYPNISQSVEGMQRVVQAVLLPGWNSQPRGAGNSGLDSRRRGTWILPGARTWRGVRQSRSAGVLCCRRRRSGDRTACYELARE